MFEDEIERLNFSLQAAAVLYVDEWILCGGENVTRCDDIGTPEVHILFPSSAGRGILDGGKRRPFLNQVFDSRRMNNLIIFNVNFVVSRDGFAIIDVIHQQTRRFA